jgi:hypothetical protein
MAYCLFSTTCYHDNHKFDSFSSALEVAEDGRQATTKETVPFIICGLNYCWPEQKKVIEWSHQDVEKAKKTCHEKGYEFMILDINNSNDVNRMTRRIVKHVLDNP